MLKTDLWWQDISRQISPQEDLSRGVSDVWTYSDESGRQESQGDEGEGLHGAGLLFGLLCYADLDLAVALCGCVECLWSSRLGLRIPFPFFDYQLSSFSPKRERIKKDSRVLSGIILLRIMLS